MITALIACAAAVAAVLTFPLYRLVTRGSTRQVVTFVAVLAIVTAGWVGYITTHPIDQSSTAGRSEVLHVNESEDLSEDVYLLTPADVIVTRSAGSVCYANDRSGQDTRQLYVSCAEFDAAGGVYGK